MRILIAAGVTANREAGTASAVYNVADGLRALGHHVDCLLADDLLPRPVLLPRFTDLYMAFRLARTILQRRGFYDVVNVHTHIGFAYGLLRKFRGGRDLPPLVVTLHGVLERVGHAMRREAAKGRAEHFRWKNRIWHNLYHMPIYRLAVTTAQHVMIVNREGLSVFQLTHGLDADRVWYVPNGVEPRFLSEREYPGGRVLRLLFVGTWLDRKGIYYLRDAFEALAARNHGLSLTVAGCLTEPERIKEWFSVPARDGVSVIPFVPREKMPALYAEHDIFVFPSLVEGMPLVLLEAMAAGMPVVTTETCGMADVVEDEQNGLLVKPADAAAFADAVERLIESPELRVRLGRAAQETMRRYTWSAVAQRVEKIFTLAITAKRG